MSRRYRRLPWMLLVCLYLALGCSPWHSPLPSATQEKPFTFVVVGDNRGDSNGKPAPAFLEIVEAIKKTSPDLVLNTGDLINGYAGESEAHLRRLWKGYRRAIAPLKMPVYHAPGNHDIFDPRSARLWKELWGPTYYAFDHRGARFIALDTETKPGRLDEAQWRWLQEQLESAGKRRVFLFFHRPLFPVDGHRGSSLDQYPRERDRLHQLFVRYRGNIQGIYQGHEHLYHFEERDGLPYYIIGGGGAPLYVPPEVGGFYHYLVVRVDSGWVSAVVKRVGERSEPRRTVRTLAPGMLLGSWENPLFWYTWDPSVRKERSRERSTEGKQGLKLSFDFSRYRYPLVYAPLNPLRDLSRVDTLKLDLYVPKGTPAGIQITPIIVAQGKSHEAPSVPLKAGWNRLSLPLQGKWLPPTARRAAEQLQWVLSPTGKTFAGWVVFDNLRAEGKEARPLSAAPGYQGMIFVSAPGLWESWESELNWGVWDDTVTHEAAPDLKTEGRRGLKLRFDLSKFERPRLYAPLNPIWDLRRVDKLDLDVYAPDRVADGVSVEFVVVAKEQRYRAPAVALTPGWNRVSVDLNGGWLPEPARSRAEQVEWSLLGKGERTAGWVVFDNFRVAH